jgi:hypothetical protein
MDTDRILEAICYRRKEISRDLTLAGADLKEVKLSEANP